jgi:hypothetical protein
MATEQVQLVFSGEGTQGGQIDGRKLGEALVAFTLMLDAAKATDPALKGTELRLTITSTAEGSFDIQAILEGMGTAWDAFAAWAEGRNGAASTQLQGFLVTVLTVLALIRDRRPREQSDEAFVETLPDGTRRAYSSEALKILQSGPFLRAARDVVEVLDEDVNRLEVVTVPRKTPTAGVTVVSRTVVSSTGSAASRAASRKAGRSAASRTTFSV